MAPARRSLVSGPTLRGWIVEDDYDGEFHDRPRLVRCRVSTRVASSTAALSKSLAAGLHIAWLVLPPSLVEPVTESSRWRVGVSAIDKTALADFITTGHLDRHLRQMRRLPAPSGRGHHNAAHARTLDDHERVSAGLHGTVLLDGPRREPTCSPGSTVIGRLPSVECPPRRAPAVRAY
jgi:DNA-binding transcriptional MocR family regulator